MLTGARMASINESNNFIYFTLSLILIFVMGALAKEVEGEHLNFLLKPLILNSFIICLASMKFARGWYIYLVGVSVLMAIAILAHSFYDNTHLSVIMLILILAFCVGVFQATAHQILLSDQVDNNKLIGSVALFLVMGLGWAAIYLLLIIYNPEAIKGIVAQDHWGEHFSVVTYFSFVTQTTLGYGDFSPNTPLAQVVVYLQGITGVFYMAVVVSSLVSARKR
ncbi:potassium channel protein [Vibrio ishigakensis]|uniref:Potassium channel protein n=1 Tax=Vibrio ishigakensis TaxID=1481914 RepID=A0A0B8PD42_9VIBR|nr:potassium channel protein [Vibrio ishigakensis]